MVCGRLLTKTIENDRYPLSPRVQTLRGILGKFGQIAPAQPPPARPPTPEQRDPSRRPRVSIAITAWALSALLPVRLGRRQPCAMR